MAGLESNQNILLEDDNNPRDYLLSLNDLGLPKVLNMSRIEPGIMNTAIITIIRLILLRKGTDPDRPDMGIDIVGRYRFAFESELTILDREIEEQITTYLPEFLPVTVSTNVVQETNVAMPYHKIQINITVDGTMYQILFNKDTEELELFSK